MSEALHLHPKLMSNLTQQWIRLCRHKCEQANDPDVAQHYISARMLHISLAHAPEALMMQLRQHFLDVHVPALQGDHRSALQQNGRPSPSYHGLQFRRTASGRYWSAVSSAQCYI
jgi:hypothetical protein